MSHIFRQTLREVDTMSAANDNSSMSLGDFIWGIVKGIVLGTFSGLRGEKLALFAISVPIGERIVGIKLEDALEDWVREQQRQETERKIAEIEASIQSIIQRYMPKVSEASNVLPQLPAEQTDTKKDSKWLEVIVHPSVVLIVGKRGSGKSALGYRLLELFRYKAAPYVLGLPAQAQNLLPDWIGVAQSLDDIPPDSIVLIDEAYIPYHSRESLKTKSREMSRLVNLSRQRNQTLLFVTQEARQIDKNVASQANVIIFKELGILQLRFDRREFNDIGSKAKQALDATSGDKRRWAYVYSPDADFMGLVDSSLATFWRPKLSSAFATVEPASGGRLPNALTREDKIAKAKELLRRGFSYRKIADILGVRVSTAYNWVNDYPYNT